MPQIPDYRVYVLTRNEKVKYLLLAATGLFAVGTLFFNNILMAAALSLGCFWFPRYQSRKLARKRQAELRLQFKNLLESLSTSISAGRSLESAIPAALSDMRVLYSNDNTDIIRELQYMCRRLELHEPVENVFSDFAVRSGLDDIRDFAEVIIICKRTGGNLVQVVKNTSQIISDKIEIIQDIDLLLTRQKFEQKLLNYMPFVFIALIRVGGSGYMDPLYSSPLGYVLMGIALVLVAAAYLLSNKINDIRV